MGRFLDTLYDVLFHPGAAMRAISIQRMVLGAFVVFLGSLFLPALTTYLMLKTMGLHKIAGIAVVLQSMGYFTLWIAGTALLHLSAEFMGGKGSALGLLSTIGFAHLPRVLLVPFFVLASLLTNGLGGMVHGGIWCLVFFWILILEIKAIKETYQLSTARAVIVILIPFAVLFVAMLAMVIMSGLSLIY